MPSYYLFVDEKVIEEVLCILQSFYINGITIEGMGQNNVLHKFIKISSSDYFSDTNIFMQIRETLYPKYKFYLLKPVPTQSRLLQAESMVI
jgi:hypothetical protein